MRLSRVTGHITCLLSLLTLAACGGGGSGTGSQTPSPPPTGSSPPPVSLPPDPGDAGMQTVEGIDSDGDGVRDDLQRHIGLGYPANAATMAALTQIAVALQKQLVAGPSKTLSIAAASQTMRAIECYLSVETGEDIQDKLSAVQSLQAETLNTQLRWRAYQDFDRQVWGEVVVSLPVAQQLDSCTFEP